MRKHLLLPSLLAIGLLGLGSSFALACNGAKTKTTSTASAAGSSCAGKTEASAASVPGTSSSAADCAAACAAAKTASAAGACGSAASVQTAGAAGHCNGAATKTASSDACAAKADFFISSYLCLSKAASGHCNVSMQTAAATWNEGLQKLIASAEAAQHREALQTLAGQLADWPADAAAADARFRAVSEWTAGYCERFPEKTAGAKVMTCPETGKRWVEIETTAADGQS